MEIRKVNISELSAFHKSYSNLAKKLFPEYSPTTLEAFVSQDKLFGRKFLGERIKEGFVWIAEKDGEVVGILIAGKPFGGISYAHWLMVDSKHQKQGIATKLLGAWENEALKKKAHGLRLDASECNVPFYKNRGFELIGFFKKGYFGENSYYLCKNIAEPKEENFLK